MHTNTAQYGVVAKRRLPSDFHTPVPLIPPAARINGTRRIRRATSVAILPSVKLYITAGKVSAALSPDKNPLAAGSLSVVRPNSNSRFFTDCYHQAAAIKPADGRKTSMRGIAPACWADAAGAAWRSPSDPDLVGNGLSIRLLIQRLMRLPASHDQAWGRRPRRFAPGPRGCAANWDQFACRRKNAGMSSWSSSKELCTGACRPRGSSPW